MDLRARILARLTEWEQDEPRHSGSVASERILLLIRALRAEVEWLRGWLGDMLEAEESLPALLSEVAREAEERGRRAGLEEAAKHLDSLVMQRATAHELDDCSVLGCHRVDGELVRALAGKEK